MSNANYFVKHDHVTVVDQYITDRYKYLTDKEIAYQLGITENHVTARRMVLNLVKGSGWVPQGYYNAEKNEVDLTPRKIRKLVPIKNEVTIDEEIYALEMYAQSRPEGSVWADIARQQIEHLKLIKLRT